MGIASFTIPDNSEVVCIVKLVESAFVHMFTQQTNEFVYNLWR